MKIINRNVYFILISMLMLCTSACTKKVAPIETLANKPAGNAYGYGFAEVIHYTVYIGALSGIYSYLGTVPIEITNVIDYSVSPLLVSSTNQSGISVDMTSNTFQVTQNLMGEQITFVIRYQLLDGNFLELTVVVGMGDLNFNCVVDAGDLGVIRNCYEAPVGSIDNLRCDLNHDLVFNNLDYAIFTAHYNTYIPNCIPH